MKTQFVILLSICIIITFYGCGGGNGTIETISSPVNDNSEGEQFASINIAITWPQEEIKGNNELTGSLLSGATKVIIKVMEANETRTDIISPYIINRGSEQEYTITNLPVKKVIVRAESYDIADNMLIYNEKEIQLKAGSNFVMLELGINLLFDIFHASGDYQIGNWPTRHPPEWFWDERFHTGLYGYNFPGYIADFGPDLDIYGKPNAAFYIWGAPEGSFINVVYTPVYLAYSGFQFQMDVLPDTVCNFDCENKQIALSLSDSLDYSNPSTNKTELFSISSTNDRTVIYGNATENLGEYERIKRINNKNGVWYFVRVQGLKKIDNNVKLKFWVKKQPDGEFKYAEKIISISYMPKYFALQAFPYVSQSPNPNQPEWPGNYIDNLRIDGIIHEPSDL
ncbi:MAG: hypothetical protein ABRQ39_22750 [Candidatus Eremiobacterota bacterium]